MIHAFHSEAQSAANNLAIPPNVMRLADVGPVQLANAALIDMKTLFFQYERYIGSICLFQITFLRLGTRCHCHAKQTGGIAEHRKI